MIASPLYTIRFPKYWLIEDKPIKGYNRENLQFHIKNDDYFGTLATSLNLLKESLEEGKNLKWGIESLRHSVSDLVFLQEHYVIKKK